MHLSGTVTEIWRLKYWTHGRGHGKTEEWKEKKEVGGDGERREKESERGKGRERGR